MCQCVDTCLQIVYNVGMVKETNNKGIDMTKRPQSVTTDKIARIWETLEGNFIIADWDNSLVTQTVFNSDADAGQYAVNAGFEEIFWEEEVYNQLPPRPLSKSQNRLRR